MSQLQHRYETRLLTFPLNEKLDELVAEALADLEPDYRVISVVNVPSQRALGRMRHRMALPLLAIVGLFLIAFLITAVPHVLGLVPRGEASPLDLVAPLILLIPLVLLAWGVLRSRDQAVGSRASIWFSPWSIYSEVALLVILERQEHL